MGAEGGAPHPAVRHDPGRSSSGCASVGFHSVNIDLIYGLPHQTVDSFAHTLVEAHSHSNPTAWRSSATRMCRGSSGAKDLLKPEAMPSPETKFAIFKLAVETLTNTATPISGWTISHKRGDELEVAQREGKLQRNFQGYSTRGTVPCHVYAYSFVVLFTVPLLLALAGELARSRLLYAIPVARSTWGSRPAPCTPRWPAPMPPPRPPRAP